MYPVYICNNVFASFTPVINNHNQMDKHLNQ
ncbi:MAG: hypothetical protein JWQ54_1516 [Mucilaginibacter sp.]|nr:hypothetical protein [Mucilaginibacter sp.]